MAKHLITFGHSPGGSPDPGTTSGSLKEAVEIRKLKPYLEKWGKESGHEFSFYEGNMYADRSITKQKGYDTVTELHMDGPEGSGGHVIIFKGYEPDAIDLALRDVIKKHFGIVNYLKPSGISKRNNLYNVNEAARVGINYRLLELFFMSNKKHHEYYLKNLDNIAKDIVEAIVRKKVETPKEPVKAPKAPKKASAEQVAQGIAAGKGGWGNNPERANKLKAAGYDAKAVQSRVNDILNAKSTPKKQSVEQVAQDIANGRGGWGNNPERARKLKAAGYNADVVQSRVNDILNVKPAPKKTSMPRVGQTITTRTLYANAMSTKNLRSSPVKGYVQRINRSWKNPIRLTNGRNGGWLGFTRPDDIL